MSQIAHSSQTAPIQEFRVLWTAQKKQKLKKWHDGTLRLHTFNNRLLLYDEGMALVADRYHHPGCVVAIEEGDEFDFEQHLVTVEEFLQTVMQDLTPVYAPAVLRQQQRAEMAAERASAWISAAKSIPATQQRASASATPVRRQPQPPQVPLSARMDRPRMPVQPHVPQRLGVLASTMQPAPVRTPVPQKNAPLPLPMFPSPHVETVVRPRTAFGAGPSPTKESPKSAPASAPAPPPLPQFFSPQLSPSCPSKRPAQGPAIARPGLIAPQRAPPRSDRPTNGSIESRQALQPKPQPRQNPAQQRSQLQARSHVAREIQPAGAMQVAPELRQRDPSDNSPDSTEPGIIRLSKPSRKRSKLLSAAPNSPPRHQQDVNGRPAKRSRVAPSSTPPGLRAKRQTKPQATQQTAQIEAIDSDSDSFETMKPLAPPREFVSAARLPAGIQKERSATVEKTPRTELMDSKALAEKQSSRTDYGTTGAWSIEAFDLFEWKPPNFRRA